jgi:hypothetical protein
MYETRSNVAGAQAAAAMFGVLFLAITVPLFGIVMLPLVALAAAGRALTSLGGAIGTVRLIE